VSLSNDVKSAVQRKTFSLTFVLVVALIAFLLGSLLRSLLTPADFILYPRQNANFVDDAMLMALDPERRWRQARRLVEFRFPWSGWDVIVAQVRK
jgi:hypothetical protein